MSMRIDITSCLPAFNASLLAQKASGYIPVIAEIKSCTPSAGDLLKGRSIASIAGEYHTGGAACLSVVTGKWFGGSADMLTELARHTWLPILRKDFITNKRQIVQSKANGAAAVLLTKKLLRTEHLTDLSAYALSIGVTPFVEISDETDVQGVSLPPGAVIAVNNKRIMDQETDCGDINKSLALIDVCRATGAGLLASASGICTPHQVRRLFKAGFDAFLIGTALLASGDIQKCLQQFSLTCAKVV